jgi:hypothetical protein
MCGFLSLINQKFTSCIVSTFKLEMQSMTDVIRIFYRDKYSLDNVVTLVRVLDSVRMEELGSNYFGLGDTNSLCCAQVCSISCLS